MGSDQSKSWSDDDIVAAAQSAGLKVYAGFKATERRILFVHDDKFAARYKLKTILPNGEQEGGDKEILRKTDRALVTYPYEQFLDEAKAKRWLNTPYVWQAKDGRYVLVHVCPINFNDEFRSQFDIREVNVEEDYFEDASAENLKKVAGDLFGEDARQETVKYCKKETKNIQRVYVGTTGQFKSLFAEEGIKDAIGIQSIDGNSVVVPTRNKARKTSTQKFTLSSDPDEVQVLYQREGWTTFMCFKPLQQFSKECTLFGLLDV